MPKMTSISVTPDIRFKIKRCADYKDEPYSDILGRIMVDSAKLYAQPSDVLRVSSEVNTRLTTFCEEGESISVVLTRLMDFYAMMEMKE